MPTDPSLPYRAPAPRWSDLSRRLRGWSKPALLALVKDLHDSSPENRRFLQARLQAKQPGGTAAEPYRRLIVEQFFPARGFGRLKLGEARKAIRDYRKASGDLPSTVELLLTYIENGTEFTRQFGDINETFYDSMESAGNELRTLLLGEGSHVYAPLRERLLRLESLADGIGWGYGDFIRDLVAELEAELGGGTP